MKEVLNKVFILYGLKTISADQDRKRFPFYLIREFIREDWMVGGVVYPIVFNGETTCLICKHKPFYYRPYRRGRSRCLECGGYKGGLTSNADYKKYLKCVKVSEDAIRLYVKEIVAVMDMIVQHREAFRGKHVKDPVYVEESILAGDWQQELADMDKEDDKIHVGYENEARAEKHKMTQQVYGDYQ